MGRPESETPTDWELNLLQILWEIGRANVDEIREHLRSAGIKRSDSSLRTILRIMVKKGLVKGDTSERTTYYTAAMKRPALEKRYFKYMVKNLFHGNQETFALRVLDEANITDDVIKKMKEIIDQHKKS